MTTYFNTYRGVASYLRSSGRTRVEKGYATSLSGRRRNFPYANVNGNVERAAKNHPIQGTNADILKRAIALLHERLSHGSHIVMTIHDEIVIEAPDDLIEDVERILKECMHEACTHFLKRVAMPEPNVTISQHWEKD